MRVPLLAAALALLAGCADSTRDRAPFLVESLAMSPDDSTLVFPYSVDDMWGLYRADADGHDVRLVADEGSGGTIRNPAVSPDGRLVAYVRIARRDRSKATLVVVPLAGGTPRTIDVGVETVTDVAFSGDGRHLYVLGADEYRRTRGPAGEYAHDIDLYSAGVDGRGLRRLTALDASVMESLDVVGDPERIVLKIGREAGNDGDYYSIDPNRPGAPAPVWTADPDAYWVTTAAVSPDGRRVAFDDRNVLGWSLMDVETQQVLPLPLGDPPPFDVWWTHRGDALLLCQSCSGGAPALTRVDVETGSATSIPIRADDVRRARAAARAD